MIAPMKEVRQFFHDLPCPACGHRGSFVVDSRGNKEGSHIRRRRLCKNCEWRFTTYEYAVLLRPEPLNWEI